VVIYTKQTQGVPNPREKTSKQAKTEAKESNSKKGGCWCENCVLFSVCRKTMFFFAVVWVLVVIFVWSFCIVWVLR